MASMPLLGLLLFCALGSSPGAASASLEEDESVLMALQPSKAAGATTEKQLPDFGKMAGDAMKGLPNPTEAVQDVMAKATDVAMKMATESGSQMNKTLDLIGETVQSLNTTVLKHVEAMQDKVSEANGTGNGKLIAFQSTLKDLLQAAMKQILPLDGQVKSATTMAVESLKQVGQEESAEKLDGEFKEMLKTTDSWTSAVNETLTGLASATIPVIGLIDEGNTEDPQSFAASLAEKLKQPLGQLAEASDKLEGLSSQASETFGSFVDSAIAAAKEKQLPDAMTGKLTELLEGVQAKAGAELEPLGSIARDLTDRIYEAADEADIPVEHSSASAMCVMWAFLSLTPLALW